MEPLPLTLRGASGRFFFVDSDLKIDEPQDELVVSPSKVADVGLAQQSVASTLGAARLGVGGLARATRARRN